MSEMKLNMLQPGPGSKKKRLRVGRGASAGQGKTCGRGVKGQRARKGGYHKVGFEGGQMPLQRRLPKVGFRSAMKATRAEVRLSELAKVKGDEITLEGKLTTPVTVRGLSLTVGALKAIEAAGGKFEAGEPKVNKLLKPAKAAKVAKAK